MFGSPKPPPKAGSLKSKKINPLEAGQVRRHLSPPQKGNHTEKGSTSGTPGAGVHGGFRSNPGPRSPGCTPPPPPPPAWLPFSWGLRYRRQVHRHSPIFGRAARRSYSLEVRPYAVLSRTCIRKLKSIFLFWSVLARFSAKVGSGTVPNDFGLKNAT